MTRPVLKPNALHPIDIAPNPRRVTVTVDGRTIADTTRALVLKEASYRAVQYFPREDVDMSALEPTTSHSYCPFKGQASYYSVRTDDGELHDAVWSYEHPHDAVPQIAGYLAFYPDRVQITEH